MKIKSRNQPPVAGLCRGLVNLASDEAKDRFVPGRTKSIDEKERLAQFVASTNEVDRHSEVILPSSFKARIGKFQKHSPFLAEHQPYKESRDPTQIGTVIAMEINQADVRITVCYAETDAAEQYWKLARDDRQSVAVSIGFIPTQWVRGTVAELRDKYPELQKPFADAALADDDQVKVYTEIELLEVSQVAVPANSGAVQLDNDGSAVRRSDQGKAGTGGRGDGPTNVKAMVTALVDERVNDLERKLLAEHATFRQYVAAEIQQLAYEVIRRPHVANSLEEEDEGSSAQGDGTSEDAPLDNGEEELTVADAASMLLEAVGGAHDNAEPTS